MLPKFSSILTQTYPPKPRFTDRDVTDLAGKIYIVTGGNSGIGKQLVRMLYSKNAKVYVAARSEERVNEAIKDIKKLVPNSTGGLVFMKLDLSDLKGVKASAEFFLARETKLNVLYNNAGVMSVADGKTSAQGFEIHLGVNVIAPFLLTRLLTPILISTAKSEPAGSTRVIWTSSFGTEAAGEESVGLSVNDLVAHSKKSSGVRYAQSKAGTWLHGAEFAKRFRADGIASVPLNPGNLASDLIREQPGFLQRLLKLLILYPPVYGAYTLLYAGLSKDITMENSGTWVVPWGRIYPIRKDLVAATKTKEEGGNGHAMEFWAWTELQVKQYL